MVLVLGEILQALLCPRLPPQHANRFNQSQLRRFHQFRFQPTPLAIPQYVGVRPFVSAIEQDDLCALPIWTIDDKMCKYPRLQTLRRARRTPKKSQNISREVDFIENSAPELFHR